MGVFLRGRGVGGRGVGVFLRGGRGVGVEGWGCF